MQFTDSGSTLYYLDSGGTIKRVGLDGTIGDPVPFAARYEVDAIAERGAVFDEAWRALNEWFYDPDFHGVDWQERRETYRPWALAASHEQDFSDVMNRLRLLMVSSTAIWSASRPSSWTPLGKNFICSSSVWCLLEN